jgi:hypothetical protein
VWHENMRRLVLLYRLGGRVRNGPEETYTSEIGACPPACPRFQQPARRISDSRELIGQRNMQGLIPTSQIKRVHKHLISRKHLQLSHLQLAAPGYLDSRL